ncbi:MAG: Ig-like domain-containing protein [Acidimicrobiales bacterium]
MTRISALVVSAALLAGACGSGTPDDVALDPVPEVPGTQVPTDDPPTDLAMVEPPLALLGATALSARPGETFAIDHLIENLTGSTRTVAATARNPTEGLVVDSAPSSLRLEPGGVAVLTTTISVPEEFENDADFEVVVVFADDVTARAALTVSVGVADTTGERPGLGDDRAVTTTNERVISYVVGNDTDPDGDLDLATLRIVAGAGRAADAVASPDGTITYEPFANRTGTDVVLYELCDTTGLCDTAALTVIVEG